jgi:hypothetical protein
VVPLCPLLFTMLASEQNASHWLREMVNAEEEPAGEGGREGGGMGRQGVNRAHCRCQIGSLID